MVEQQNQKLRFFDIAANLADETFQGIYYGKQQHECDLDDLIQRANDVGCDRFLVVGGHIEDSIGAYEICKDREKFYCTIGVHPCRANEVEKSMTQQEYFQKIEDYIQQFSSKLVAIGECGLDYDRFNYAVKEDQLKQFPPHFDLAEKYKLPMYLHERNTQGDFFKIVKENRHKFSQGVVHSFTGTEQEIKEILSLDLFIGVNGCSLKTQDNLDMLKQIPMDKIMLETDCPYCEIRQSHASSKYVKTKFTSIKKEKFKKGQMVKGRNEPCTIKQVSEVVSAVLGISEQELTETAYKNTLKLFNLKDE